MPSRGISPSVVAAGDVEMVTASLSPMGGDSSGDGGEMVLVCDFSTTTNGVMESNTGECTSTTDADAVDGVDCTEGKGVDFAVGDFEARINNVVDCAKHSEPDLSDLCSQLGDLSVVEEMGTDCHQPDACTLAHGREPSEFDSASSNFTTYRDNFDESRDTFDKSTDVDVDSDSDDNMLVVGQSDNSNTRNLVVNMWSILVFIYIVIYHVYICKCIWPVSEIYLNYI